MIKNNQHMKTLIRTFVCLGVLFAAASCQLYKIDTQMTPEKAAAGIKMVCDALPSYTAASTNAEAISFTVSSNTPWTITRSSGADWCTVTPSSSANSSLISNVVVTLANNTGSTDRSATLTLRGENIAAPVTIAITQNRLGRLFVTPVAQDYVAAGGPLTFTINTNQDWSVRSDASWLHFNRENGAPDPDGNTLTIIATADPSQVLERTATVIVTAGDDEESFEVTQAGRFELTQASQEFPGNGGSQVMKIRTDLPWSISSDKNWITFDKESGQGDGSSVDITVTASSNEEAARKAVITVTAGDATKTFEVAQAGAAFEIVAPAVTELDRTGGTVILEVNAALDWTPETDVPGWTVEKTDASHFTVTAPWNNRFAPKTGKVAITGAGGARSEVEFTQGVNFEFTDAEVLEDGSVKLYSGKKCRVSLIDPARYVSFVLEMGEVSFDDKAEFVLSTHDAGGNGELQCQIRLGAGKNRLRTNGGATAYNTKDIGITVAELNAIKEYRMDFRPNADDPAMIDLEFFYNGVSKALMTSKSPYAGNTDTGHYFFGTEDASSGSASWFIVKTCTPTFIAE